MKFDVRQAEDVSQTREKYWRGIDQSARSIFAQSSDPDDWHELIAGELDQALYPPAYPHILAPTKYKVDPKVVAKNLENGASDEEILRETAYLCAESDLFDRLMQLKQQAGA